MATKQTRRSISVRGTTYDHLRQFSEAEARSMSDIVEELLARLFDKSQAARVEPAHPVRVEPAHPVRVEPARPVKAVAPARDKRSRTVAAKVVRAPLQRTPPSQSDDAPAGKSSVGRPAPTPAAVVPGTQRAAAPKGDYRMIRF